MYISKTNKNPGYSINDIYCGVFGVDMCTVPENLLVENETYYIGVYCMDDCNFTMKVKYE
jgi:hypothetical protein